MIILIKIHLKSIFKTILIITLPLASCFHAAGQSELNDTTLLKIFDDAYELVVSDDESLMAVLNGSKYLEIFSIDSLNLVQSVRVSRNAWLSRAYFDYKNKLFFWDYGMQANIKYKMLIISSGKISKIECISTNKGCSYKSLKYCDEDDNPILTLENKPYFFKAGNLDIRMYKVE